MTEHASTQPGTELALSPRAERAVAARDAIEAGVSRPLAIVPRTFLELQSLCAALAFSDLIPARLKEKQADILVTVMSGSEVGLPPMASLRLYDVIDGLPRLRADGLAATITASPLCEYLEFSESTDTRATWRTKKRGRPEQSITWTIERARRAGLVDRVDRNGKPGNWVKYPEAMLNARCKAELCRLVYPEICAGMITAEEFHDGAIDVDFTEGFTAPPPKATQTFGAAARATEPPVIPPPPEAPKRGPGRPPKVAAVVDVPANANAPDPVPAAKLDAAIAKVESKPAAPPAPPAAPAANNGHAAPAPVDSFGEDPVDVTPAAPVRGLDQFFAWLASCRTRSALLAEKESWIAWSKATFATGTPEAISMQTAYAKRTAEVPE